MTPAQQQAIQIPLAEARRLARKTRLRLEAEQRVREARACMEETHRRQEERHP